MLVRTQILLWIDGCLAIAAILFVMWQGRPWRSPFSSKSKISRAIQVGIGVFFAIPTILTVFDLKKEPDHLGISYLTSFVLLLCFTLPFSVIAAVGSLFTFSVLDELRKRTIDKRTK